MLSSTHCFSQFNWRHSSCLRGESSFYVIFSVHARLNSSETCTCHERPQFGSLHPLKDFNEHVYVSLDFSRKIWAKSSCCFATLYSSQQIHTKSVTDFRMAQSLSHNRFRRAIKVFCRVSFETALAEWAVRRCRRMSKDRTKCITVTALPVLTCHARIIFSVECTVRASRSALFQYSLIGQYVLTYLADDQTTKQTTAFPAVNSR